MFGAMVKKGDDIESVKNKLIETIELSFAKKLLPTKKSARVLRKLLWITIVRFLILKALPWISRTISPWVTGVVFADRDATAR